MAFAAFAFRYRFIVIPLLLIVSAAGAFALAPVAPFPRLVGVLSLPRGAIYGGTGDAWEWLALPLALIGIGFALRVWGTSYLRGAVMRDAIVHSDRLIVAGPFRYTRNPLYLGNLFLAAAFGLLLPPPGILFSVGLMFAMGLTLIRAEEPELAAAHPHAFAHYARAVPRLLPRLTPARGVPSADVRPSWRGALVVESGLSLLFVAGLVGVLNQVAAVFVCALGIVLLRWGGGPP